MPDSDQISVLHVDDDADIQEIAMLALEAIGGMQVVQAGSGAEALEKLQSFKPDVLLLDYMMPEMSGEDLYKQIQIDPSLRDVPCIFVTARVQVNEVKKLKELGVKDVIQKPFDPMSLSDDIRRIIAQ